MFKTRLLSGIVLVALALILIITGGNVLLVSTLIISEIGLFELYRVFHMEKSAAGIVGYLAVIIFYLDLAFRFIPFHAMFPVCLMVVLLIVFVLGFPKFSTEQIMAAFFGVYYVAVMLSYIYQTRMLDHGEYLVWLIFLCSWGCDTSAYCVGRLFGKHKMAPVLSPKKSVEGAIGGVAGAMILTLIYCFLLRLKMHTSGVDILLLTLSSGVGALISMVGDLAASAIKRNYDIKDYGKLIPGHGGILDRFDSVIITAPIIFYLSALIGR